MRAAQRDNTFLGRGFGLARPHIGKPDNTAALGWTAGEEVAYPPLPLNLPEIR